MNTLNGMKISNRLYAVLLLHIVQVVSLLGLGYWQQQRFGGGARCVDRNRPQAYAGGS